MNTQRVPKEFAHAAAKERLEYFKKSAPIGHRILNEVYAKVKAKILEPGETMIINILGASGVGKTTLFRKLSRSLSEELIPTLQTDPGRIPVISIEAPAPEYGLWKWKDYNIRLMLTANELWPLIKNKNGDLLKIAAGITVSNFRRTSSSDLTLAVERMLLARRPVAVLVDEAQHMTRIATGRSREDTLDKLKSIANLTGTTHVLFGSYELLHFRNLSAQLTRRSSDIHFPRYVIFSKNGKRNERCLADFLEILESFEVRLPLQKDSNLVEHWSFLYERSIGCVGILKELLVRALERTLEKKEESISFATLNEAALNVRKCQKLLDDAIEGEENLEEERGAREKLQLCLGLPSAVEQRNDKKLLRKTSRKGVGLPRPTRYSVGHAKA